MENWDLIKTNVEENGNVLTFTMSELRDAAGKDRLGANVVSSIGSTLAGMGLGHIPSKLPNNQHAQVRLYKRGTPVGDFIETILAPGEPNDRKIRDQIGESDMRYASIVEEIRELVAE